MTCDVSHATNPKRSAAAAQLTAGAWRTDHSLCSSLLFHITKTVSVFSWSPSGSALQGKKQREGQGRGWHSTTMVSVPPIEEVSSGVCDFCGTDFDARLELCSRVSCYVCGDSMYHQQCVDK